MKGRKGGYASKALFKIVLAPLLVIATQVQVNQGIAERAHQADIRFKTSAQAGYNVRSNKPHRK